MQGKVTHCLKACKSQTVCLQAYLDDLGGRQLREGLVDACVGHDARGCRC